MSMGNPHKTSKRVCVCIGNSLTSSINIDKDRIFHLNFRNCVFFILCFFIDCGVCNERSVLGRFLLDLRKLSKRPQGLALKPLPSALLWI